MTTTVARQDKRESVKTSEESLAAADVNEVHLSPKLVQLTFDFLQSRLDKTWGLGDCVSMVAVRDYVGNLAISFS